MHESKQNNRKPDSSISRRRFLMMAGTGVIAFVVPPASDGERKGTTIMPTEPETPIPDTLDLVERADLVINAITRCTNPEAEHAVYFYTNLYRNPPTMIREIPLYGKFIEGLALARLMTGSTFNQHVDRIWQEALLRKLDEEKPVLLGPEGGRQTAWLGIQYAISKDAVWKELGESAIRRALDAAVHKDGYCYFPHDPSAMPTGWAATFQGWTLQGVTQFYNATGSDFALELAGKLARYLKDHAEVFNTEGRFLARHDVSIPLSPESPLGPALHFHHNGNAMDALAEYALATGDAEFTEFVKKSYHYARSLNDSSPLVGFFPEYIKDWPDERGVVDSEGCCVVDMLLTALWLTKAGVGDYWDDIDRYLRNQFAEMQMTSGDWITRMAEKRPSQPVGADEVAIGAPDRCTGSFAGWSSANDFYVGAGNGIMHCCTGNGARALYYLWDNMIDFREGELHLHLLLNRDSAWAEVASYIPHQGRVGLKLKQECTRVVLRVPEWIETRDSSISCRFNGASHKLGWEGRYVVVEDASPGDTIRLDFPIPERTVEETIGDVNYTLRLKGNNVVSISPAGKNYPFYQERAE
jgi:hypothetical protein